VGQPALGSRPSSGSLAYTAGNCPTGPIENRTFRDLGSNVIAIRISGCDGVVIRDNDFINVSQGIYITGGADDWHVTGNRYQNITGPYERVGLNRANFIQVNGTADGLIARNVGRCGDTEDIVSIYKSSRILVEDNHFEGVYTNSPGCLAWRSSSGTCILLADGTGSGNIARRNTCVNAGQVGIGVAGGTNNRIENNIVIGEQRSSPASNVGIYVQNYAGTPESRPPCTGNVVSNNRVQFRNSAGTSNSIFLGSRCTGTVSTGNTTNDPNLRAADYKVSF
jgi:nitrous oxidase accessory protein NosD